MSSRFVREIGRVESAGLIIGVDHDTVTIATGRMAAGGPNWLDQERAGEFARLFTAACWEAARCHQCDCPPEYQPEEA